jgi:hypothetical protein
MVFKFICFQYGNKVKILYFSAYAECPYAEHRNTEYRCADCRYAKYCNVVSKVLYWLTHKVAHSVRIDSLTLID